jgi:hypothetical protein
MTKPVSRQRRWQIKQRAKKRCMLCGRKLKRYRVYCDKHAVARAARQHRVLGLRGHSRTYLQGRKSHVRPSSSG